MASAAIAFASYDATAAAAPGIKTSAEVAFGAICDWGGHDGRVGPLWQEQVRFEHQQHSAACTAPPLVGE
jgi:hypothetical protein